MTVWTDGQGWFPKPEAVEVLGIGKDSDGDKIYLVRNAKGIIYATFRVYFPTR